MREGTLAIADHPEADEVAEVSGCEHVYHEYVGKLVPYQRKVLTHRCEGSIFPGEIPDHDTQEGIEATADDATGS